MSLISTDSEPNQSAGSSNDEEADASDTTPANEPDAAAPIAGSCVQGVLNAAGTQCYIPSIALLGWQEAEQQCAADGGHLARIDNAEDDAIVAGLIFANFWIGASDIVQDNLWVWNDRSLVEFGNWGPGQPDDFLGPDCVEKRLEPLRRWFDQPCGDPHLFVCEVPAL